MSKHKQTGESGLIDYLRRFNRKERFILLNAVCGCGTFSIDPDFAACLEEKLKLKCAIPCDAFVAMDYHLDWLQLALHLTEEGCPEDGLLCNSSRSKSKVRLFEGNQQDIDMLIAFSYDDVDHLILIEAKADTGWNKRQLGDKVERIVQIFGNEGDEYDVSPHFVLMSVKPPGEQVSWPKWMHSCGKPHWVPICLDEDTLKATRCNEKGRASKDGKWLCLSKWVDGETPKWKKMRDVL